MDEASTAASDVGIEERMLDFAESDNEEEDDFVDQPTIWASCQEASIASSKKRWADMKDSEDEKQVLRQPHEPAKLAWADMADSEEDEEGFPEVVQEEDLTKQRGEGVKPKRRRRRGKKAASPAETAPVTGSDVGHPLQHVASSQTRHNSKPSADSNSKWWSQSWETSDSGWKNQWSSQQWGSKSSAKSRQGERKAAHGGKPQCQFFIGIEEESKFKVTRKVLGSHGKFMKAIAETTGAKLRLRGRGSGFLEGPEQVESVDELMLCVSATDVPGYREAVRQVHDLLEGVYTEYRAFCKKMGLTVPELQVRMHEGPRPGSF